MASEKDYLIENLSTMLGSGMDVVVALDSLEVEIKSRGLKKAIARIKEDLESGTSLWKAFEKSKVVNANTVSLIRIGEESGRLSENLRMIADQQEKDRNFKARLRSGLMYPVGLLLITIVLGSGIAWFILPKLASVFSSLKMELPMTTRILIASGKFLEKSGAIFVPSFIFGFFLVLYVIFFMPKTRKIGQFLLFSTPGVKTLIKEAEIGRFAYLLGQLLDAGVPLVVSLRSLAESANFYKYRKLYFELAEMVDEGNSFYRSFQKSKHINALIPRPIQQMIISAESSGKLPEILLKVGQIYEEKTEITTKNLTVILEPIMLVIVWLGVVFIALAVILPIYSLIGGLNS